MRKKACEAIARFFYNNTKVAKSEEFNVMFDLVLRQGNGFKYPSYHGIRVKSLKEKVKNTSLVLQEHSDEENKMYNYD